MFMSDFYIFRNLHPNKTRIYAKYSEVTMRSFFKPNARDEGGVMDIP